MKKPTQKQQIADLKSLIDTLNQSRTAREAKADELETNNLVLRADLKLAQGKALDLGRVVKRLEDGMAGTHQAIDAILAVNGPVVSTPLEWHGTQPEGTEEQSTLSRSLNHIKVILNQ